MTHSDLIEIGRKWLSRPWRTASIEGHGACSVILTDITTSNPETPDVIGWSGNKCTLIECKTSISDFRADLKKPFRVYPEQGLGHKRYYLAPGNIIPVNELPKGWGLLEVDEGQKVTCICASSLFKSNSSAETMILLSVLRRVAIIPDKCVSLRVFASKTKNRASLTVA